MTTDLSRVGNFALQEKQKRVAQFIAKLSEALQVLSSRKLPKKIIFVVSKIEQMIKKIDSSNDYAKELLADDAFTYGAILSHRAMRL